MIENALRFIKQQLDQHLESQFNLNDSAVIVNALIGFEGVAPKENINKVVITMINLDHELGDQYFSTQRRSSEPEIATANPVQCFNLDLLFTAYFFDYQQSLKYLSSTIGFFQANSSFNLHNTVGKPDAVSSLTFEIENTSLLDRHNLWSVMGARYQPSIIYKVRHITIGYEPVNTVDQSVQVISAELNQVVKQIGFVTEIEKITP